LLDVLEAAGVSVTVLASFAGVSWRVARLG
jgi:hypothetical protein